MPWHSLLAAWRIHAPCHGEVQRSRGGAGRGQTNPQPGTSSAFLLLASLPLCLPICFPQGQAYAQVRTENHLGKENAPGGKLECYIATTVMSAFLIRQFMVSRCMDGGVRQEKPKPNRPATCPSPNPSTGQGNAPKTGRIRSACNVLIGLTVQMSLLGAESADSLSASVNHRPAWILLLRAGCYTIASPSSQPYYYQILGMPGSYMIRALVVTASLRLGTPVPATVPYRHRHEAKQTRCNAGPLLSRR